MKRLFIVLSLLWCGFACADTINLHWKNEDGSTYQNSTCTVDGDLIIPSTTPTKYGYTFAGWKVYSYIPIEYIESTGTQCIDTDYIVQSRNTKVEIVVSSGNYSSSTLYSWNRKNSDSDWMVLFSNIMWIGSGSVTINLPKGQKNTFIFETDDYSAYKYSINGGTINQGTYSGNFISDPTPVYIFCQKTSGGFFRQISAKIYSFKLWVDNILVRNMIPVLDENNTPCMFDFIEHKFYYNVGTGQFIAGPELL